MIGLAGFGRDWGISGLDSGVSGGLDLGWFSLVLFGGGISVGLSPDRVSGVYIFTVL